MIKITGLVKKYGPNTAIDHVSFNVERGKIYGLLGPNGAGKSTIMNILTGYVAATEGDVWIDGANILTEPIAAKRAVGYLPEHPPLYLNMTTEEYLLFAAALKGLPKKNRRAEVERVMTAVSVLDMRRRLLQNLSKGYQQRVGIAQAIIGGPPLIILDEPSVGLDPQQIIDIRALIRSLGHSHTVVFSSHILSEVEAVCDHVLILSKGKLVASGTPETLRQSAKGAQQLRLVVRGEEARISAALGAVEGIERIACHSAPREEGACVVTPRRRREGERVLRLGRVAFGPVGARKRRRRP